MARLNEFYVGDHDLYQHPVTRNSNSNNMNSSLSSRRRRSGYFRQHQQQQQDGGDENWRTRLGLYMLVQELLDVVAEAVGECPGMFRYGTDVRNGGEDGGEVKGTDEQELKREGKKDRGAMAISTVKRTSPRKTRSTRAVTQEKDEETENSVTVREGDTSPEASGTIVLKRVVFKRSSSLMSLRGDGLKASYKQLRCVDCELQSPIKTPKGSPAEEKAFKFRPTGRQIRRKSVVWRESLVEGNKNFDVLSFLVDQLVVDS
ncbi:hypothetical protein BDZ91DRAFT_780536 [Kalaharituber pfeilii]|nr:hypothetical protein BDZ91DRAFT_780536 [Kalaharituber pfeilii]